MLSITDILNVMGPYHSLDQFPTGAFSSEKESDGGSNTLTSCVNVVKRHVEINLIECQNIDLNKFLEMVREHNLTTYTLLAVTPITVHVPASTPSDDFK